MTTSIAENDKITQRVVFAEEPEKKLIRNQSIISSHHGVSIFTYFFPQLSALPALELNHNIEGSAKYETKNKQSVKLI